MTVLTNKQAVAPLGPTATATAPRSAGALVKAYVALTKPRIIELLLITTLPVMFLAARGLPDLWTATATMIFGTLSAGSANVLNCYIDRDIDRTMRRTRRRPLAKHDVSPAGALVFGVILGTLSTLGLALTVNGLAAALSLGAILFYVFVYSLVLKRRTSQNIVWGGIAGCMPVLIGWAGITGGLSWAPVVLFGVVFFWTPPHTWTLAMRYREDYAAAEVPMLPVVATERRVVQQVVAYTWATVLCSLLLWPVAGTSLFYPAVALVLGVVCLVEVHRLLGRVNAGRTGVDLRPMRFFHWSNIYLALLFLAVAIDSLLV
ncbi:protoheme IX farnesyltransferase [Microbispora triticiradicis]|uniref:Protoheme IX farnesyltransferase n=3 Tax=Microbispora TaxID=2005 RepID=A0ABY3LWW8_9ACTN|nr:protoheme IX farnesyltransferase [Microbispora triticiradicis]TLP59863.1 protoheme IX farnesyltransferase [Microbispora fusca]TYB58223.1 protoheme IX farnesyltransferase [Microbispora tritici]GLW23338.1 protoheme IX farnesyltransferase [Microbispora amethystogenes]